MYSYSVVLRVSPYPWQWEWSWGTRCQSHWPPGIRRLRRLWLPHSWSWGRGAGRGNGSSQHWRYVRPWSREAVAEGCLRQGMAGGHYDPTGRPASPPPCCSPMEDLEQKQMRQLSKSCINVYLQSSSDEYVVNQVLAPPKRKKKSSGLGSNSDILTVLRFELQTQKPSVNGN